MQRSSWLLLGAMTIATHACVGSDPDTSTALPPDASADGSTGVADSGADATVSSDADALDAIADVIADVTAEDAASCGAVPAANGASFECGASACTAGATDVCCRRGGSFGCGSGTGGCDDTVVDIQCDGPADCGSLACCLAAAITGTCPASAGTQVKLACNALVNCTGAGKYVTCNGSCDGGKTCTPTTLPTGKTIGVCL